MEVARQICAGLSAAHDRGVVHRDLKPANIMVDGTGRIRITDFGLAGMTGETLRAGTPAYMAPEQLAGGEVTPRSDLYSLGLVLYEVFTGRRALDGRNLAELIAKREQAGITLPTDIVRDLDPAIERAIMRCLELDPDEASGLGAGGRGRAAGRRSPGRRARCRRNAVAGNGRRVRRDQRVEALGAFACLAFSLGLVIVGVHHGRSLPGHEPGADAEAAAAARRSRQSDPAARSVRRTPSWIPRTGSRSAGSYIRYLTQHQELGTPGDCAAAGRRWWSSGFGTARRTMVPAGDRDRVSATNPPMTVSGMSYDRRWIRKAASSSFALCRRTGSGSRPAPVDWKPLFDAADLDMAAFTSAEPEWTPVDFTDTRAAWTGPLPGIAGRQLRVEAGGYRGKATYFRCRAVVAPVAHAGRRLPSARACRDRRRWARLRCS